MTKLIRITTVPISLLLLLKDQLKFVSEYYDVVAVSSGGELLDKVKKEQQVATFAVNLTREITPIRDVFALIKLYRYFRRERPGIVHTHTPKAGLLGMIAAKWAGVPIRMHTVAGLPILTASGFKKNVLSVTEKITSNCATYVYPNSFKLAEIMAENNYCEPAKIKVIGNGSSNGLNTAIYDLETQPADKLDELKKELDIQSGDVVFCFVGRIVSDKGINELVSSFLQLNEQNPHIKLLLVGPFEAKLDPIQKDSFNQIKGNPNILHVGYQEDIRPYLAISNVFVFPSYREGFPNVVMQAGAMSLPCIVTDINGCNEIIQEGVNGTIIPPQNRDALFNAMKELLDDNGKRIQLASKSRDIIVAKYGQQFVWNELLKEYRKLEGEYSK